MVAEWCGFVFCIFFFLLDYAPLKFLEDISFRSKLYVVFKGEKTSKPSGLTTSRDYVNCEHVSNAIMLARAKQLE